MGRPPQKKNLTKREIYNRAAVKRYRATPVGYARQILLGSRHSVRRGGTSGLPITATVEEFLEWFGRQPYVCKICGEKPPAGVRLCVDHDHATGKLRGLLCQRCNLGIGFIERSPDDWVDKVRQYLSYGDAHLERI